MRGSESDSGQRKHSGKFAEGRQFNSQEITVEVETLRVVEVVVQAQIVSF